jgi:anaerobic selenocysteine-containing dehydrogenase
MSRRKEYDLNSSPEGAPIVWRSLESKNDSARSYELAKQEFPFSLKDAEVLQKQTRLADTEADVAGNPDAGFGRRSFMLFAGATASLFGCARRPVEKILPYARQPEQAVPGLSYYYATSRSHRGEAIGLLVESHEGRPTKIEGNPDHPSSLGGTDAFTQATVWDLYDPDRSREPRTLGAPATLKDVDAALAAVIERAKSAGGKGLRILMGPTNSPTTMRLREAVKSRFPEAKFHAYASVTESTIRQGSKLAFDQVVNTVVDFEKAKTIVALDCDFLGTEAGSIRNARGFANSRRLRAPTDSMSRLYVIEPNVTPTGLASDHRLPLAASEVEGYLLALASELVSKHGVDLGSLGAVVKGATLPAGIKDVWQVAVAKDLAGSRGRGILTVGSRQPARVHALAHALNWALGNAGQTIAHYPATDKDEPVDTISDFKALAKDIEGGKVETLIVLGGNPVYDAPSELKFASLLSKVKLSFHLSSHFDETSRACTWHIPRSHSLETWSDHRSSTGVLSIQQPLIQPLHASKGDLEILGKLANEPSPKAMTMVQDTARSNAAVIGLFEKGWAVWWPSATLCGNCIGHQQKQVKACSSWFA